MKAFLRLVRLALLWLALVRWHGSPLPVEKTSD
jgi:hypothetical protein